MTTVRDSNQNDEDKPDFPVQLFEIPYNDLIREMIKVHPGLLLLFYKRFTSKIRVDVVKSLIPLYHQKKDWFNALSHLSRLGLITYDATDLHRIEPEKVHITKLGRKVIESWMDSELFKAFRWLEVHNPEIFKETALFVKFFNDNFRAYRTQRKNIIFREKIPSKSYVDILIYCGFCNENHDTFIDYDIFHRYLNNGSDYFIEGINCNSYQLSFIFKINFSKQEFSIFVNYLDPEADLPYDLQDCYLDTDIKLNLRNNAVTLRNLHEGQIEVNLQKRKRKVKIKQIIKNTVSIEVKSSEIRPEIFSQKIPIVPLIDVKVEEKISTSYKPIEKSKR